eukprot:CAMPEP_0168635518 /NCGR_PEP_ID=MMETSP0503-20121227/3568_1 /TAXON_ID=89963 /ORGANISM="Heterocapsa rotundata, Strain SCCAP K-0483" /LENGTH=44 /DNA_ID= /DNA_START= /DNA_END= /DNA_ORIENTATION=
MTECGHKDYPESSSALREFQLATSWERSSALRSHRASRALPDLR